MIVPVILAAGASIRMGRPKALVDFDGQTCLELALAACGHLRTPIIVLGHAADEVPLRIDLARTRIIVNQDYERGQTSSLKAGLRALPPEAKAFLLFPVDHPLVRRIEVDRLVAASRSRDYAAKKIFIPSYNLRRGHPVLFHAAIKEEFLGLPDDAPARVIINHRPERIAHIDMDGPEVLLDMDTPEDYDRCLQTYRKRCSP